MVLTLEQAKAHCNIEDDFTDDDNYILELISSSVCVIENDIRDTIENIEVDGVVPKSIEHAAKLLVGHFYENREPVAIGVSVTKIPLSYEYLIEPYKNWTVV